MDSYVTNNAPLAGKDRISVAVNPLYSDLTPITEIKEIASVINSESYTSISLTSARNSFRKCLTEISAQDHQVVILSKNISQIHIVPIYVI